MKTLSFLKKSMYSALVFFWTVTALTIGYSNYISSYPASVGSGSGLTASEWNKIVSGLQTLDTNLTSLTSQINNPPPGTIVQTIVKTSIATWSLDTTTFTEVNPDYRISFTPKFNNSKILIEYSFNMNTGLAANTIFHMQLIRGIGGTESLVGAGNPMGLKEFANYVSRPNNGYDSNDMGNIYMVGQDLWLTAGTTYTYGFKYHREAGWSGRSYFNYSTLDSTIGFYGTMIMKITEITQ